MSNFLFEILVEEIPHSVLPKAYFQLKEHVPFFLDKHGLSHENTVYYASPRRLAFLVKGLPAKAAPRFIEQKGPSLKAAYTPDGKPTKALEGFFSSYNVSQEDLIEKEVKGQVYLFLQKTEEGLVLADVLSKFCADVIGALKFSEPMRWNMNHVVFEFIRPVRGVTAMIDSSVLPLSFFGCSSSNKLYGHRQFFPEPVTLTHAEHYEKTLHSVGVIPSLEERMQSIKKDVEKICAPINALPSLDEELLSILACLTEDPHPVLASFDKRFLEIPPEVLVSEMKVHQKYIPLFDTQGSLLPYYIITANIPLSNPEAKENVLRGNSRVFTARAEDGAFFYEEDNKKGLTYYKNTLDSVTFVEGAGSLADKITRMHKLAFIIQKQLEVSFDQKSLDCAIDYCKADLSSLMVGEFSELQGTMGWYYAKNSGFPEDASLAIKEHYFPLAGQTPSTALSGFVGLIDRLDNLCTLFAVGKTVTGSRDPYALRRQAIAVIHILMQFSWDKFSVRSFLSAVLPVYQEILVIPSSEWKTLLIDFIKIRLEGVLKADPYGYASDTISAILEAGFDNILSDIMRVQALQSLRATDTEVLNSVVELAKRIGNITKGQAPAEFNEDLLLETAEKALYKDYLILEKELVSVSNVLSFKKLMGLGSAIEAFFETVMVKCGGEIEKNRIALLQKIEALFKRLADFSRLSLE